MRINKIKYLHKIAALNFSEEESRADTPESLYKLFKLDNDLISRIKDLERLNQLSMEAYEDNSPDAEDLNAEFAEAEEELGNMMAETGFAGESNTGGSDPEHQHRARDLSEMSLEFAQHYFNFLLSKTDLKDWDYKVQDYKSSDNPEKDLAKLLRMIAKNYGWSNGGFIDETTDEQLIEAAKDSYDHLASKRRERKGRKRIGYKIVGSDRNGFFSLQNPSQRYDLKIGDLAAPSGGLYLGTSEQFVDDYYSGLTDHKESTLKFRYDPKDVISGSPEEEGEIRVTSAILIDFKIPYKEYWNESVEDLYDEYSAAN